MTKEQLTKGLMAFAQHLESMGAENITLGIEPHLEYFVDNEATKYGFIDSVSGCFECVVLYRKMQGDKELYQSYHRGKTKDEALRDFFNTIGEKGINVLWLNNC